MSTSNLTKKVTLSTLNQMTSEGEKFTCLTAYDYTFAKLISDCGVESILVGDSLGMVVQGHDSTLPVSIEQMAYHTAAVKRGNDRALLITDMPFMSYATTDTALKNAGELMQAGAEMVKLEGGEWLCDTVAQLANNGVPTCLHLGLTPQSVNKFGGFKVQGRSQQGADKILNDAKALEEAGADILLLECIPADLATELTRSVSIPVIGIGAGANTDAQVLVQYDMLGLNQGHVAKFVKDYLAAAQENPDPSEPNLYRRAIQMFVDEVKQGTYPGPEHSFSR